MTSRNITLIVVTALLTPAGCGGDKDEGGDSGAKEEKAQTTESKATGDPVGNLGGRQAADAFVACFDEDGYKEQILPDPFGVSAGLASAKGYDVTSVLLNSDKGALYGTAVSFFESEAKLKEAKRKLNLDFGTADVPEADERGSAVVEYVAKPARPATRDAVLRCLG
jgi:hypothetical protein